MLLLALTAAVLALSAAAPNQRIVNGIVADVGEFPFQASLQLTGRHICGAVVIDSNFVLTAAHCVDSTNPPADYTIACGVHNLETETGQRRVAQTIVKHESYSSSALGYPNDIAIIRVANPFVEDARCQFARLPITSKTYAGKKSKMSGWGRLQDGGPVATLLKKAEVDVITNSRCGTYYDLLGGLIKVINSCHICVQDPTAVRGACNGDSGGPVSLVDLDTGNWKVAGLTSFGRTGCDTSYPSVYTRVSCFLDWIQSKKAQLG